MHLPLAAAAAVAAVSPPYLDKCSPDRRDDAVLPYFLPAFLLVSSLHSHDSHCPRLVASNLSLSFSAEPEVLTAPSGHSPVLEMVWMGHFKGAHLERVPKVLS